MHIVLLTDWTDAAKRDAALQLAVKTLELGVSTTLNAPEKPLAGTGPALYIDAALNLAPEDIRTLAGAVAPMRAPERK